MSSLKESQTASFQSTLLGNYLLAKHNSPEIIAQFLPKGTKHYVEESSYNTYQGAFLLTVVNVKKGAAELKMTASSDIINEHIKEYLGGMIGDIYKYKEWDLVFSIAHDGVNYGTLYRKAKSYSPTLVVIEDTRKHVFGIYASQPWKSSQQFYGTGETFVFSFKDTRHVRVYRWTRKNDMFLYSDNKCVAAGGGGQFAVRVGEDFYKGECGVALTFDNELLSDQHFTVRSFEVWGVLK